MTDRHTDLHIVTSGLADDIGVRFCGVLRHIIGSQALRTTFYFDKSGSFPRAQGNV